MPEYQLNVIKQQHLPASVVRTFKSGSHSRYRSGHPPLCLGVFPLGQLLWQQWRIHQITSA